MIALALLIAAAVADGHLKYKCEGWFAEPLPMGDGQSATGDVMLFAQDGQIWVETKDVKVMKDGAVVDSDYVGHVHAKACNDEAGGGHWLIDASKPATPVDFANELWDSNPSHPNAPNGHSATKADTMKPSANGFATDPLAFVLHQKVEGNPKRVCCDLVKVGAGPAAPAPAVPAGPVYMCDGKEVDVATWSTMFNECMGEVEACKDPLWASGNDKAAEKEKRSVYCECGKQAIKCAEKCSVTAPPAPPAPPAPAVDHEAKCKEVCMDTDHADYCDAFKAAAPAPAPGPGGPAPGPGGPAPGPGGPAPGPGGPAPGPGGDSPSSAAALAVSAVAAVALF